jgi:predicted metalloendopeptidase
MLRDLRLPDAPMTAPLCAAFPAAAVSAAVSAAGPVAVSVPPRRRLLTALAGLPLAGASVRAGASVPAPCDDFYGHVNGAWIAATELPPDRARIGSFDGLRQRNQTALQEALRAALADRRLLDTPGKRLAADFFASGMDAAAIAQRGTAAIAPLLDEIGALPDRAALSRAVARLAEIGLSAPVSISVSPDARDKRRHRVLLWQAGLGLPDRDDYFRDDARAREVRDGYRSYITRLLELAGAGADAARRDAAAVMVFEARLAQASMKRADMRDPNALYNLRTAEALNDARGGLDWPALLGALSLGGGEAVVAQPGFIDGVNLLAREAPLDTWKSYLRVRLLDAASAYLAAPWQDAHFAFHSGTLRGLKQRPSREEEVIELISGRVGEAPLAEGLGELFVARAFSPQARARAVAMVQDIRAALRERIGRLDWMSVPTRQRAIAKLDAMTLQIGYPDRFRRYDGLTIDPRDFAGNWLRAMRYESARRSSRLAEPVYRGEWFTSPHIVNAFAGGFNNIVFPAGILQPPFFDPAADDATNYGGIGAVIGHEIIHHFDDRGRRFDAVGNLADWWTAEDAAAYQARADRLAAQFSGYAPLPGHSINGVNTLGENISDLGGVKIAFDGLQRALVRTPAAASPAGQPTPQQKFFISYATIWRNKMRAEALITQLRSGQHSPARYRVLGPLSNVPAFGEAFACPPGSPMQRAEAERIAIW